MEAPIEVLRIDQSTVSKEISRFRPCDNDTRCFYCRDWAQYIYKKHFTWAAKTQEEVFSQETFIKAGPYELCFLDQDIIPKERATKLAKRFEKLLSKGQARAIDIFAACYLWTKLPSALSGLPDMFDRIEFNPFPDAIPLADDPSDPAQLLDPLVIERQSLCLPSDSFHLLKNLTGDILLSHTQPTCDHMKPESKSPTELDVDRVIFNENSADIINTALKELKLALDRAWSPFYLFLEKMEQHERRRSKLMGSECKTEIDEYVKNQNYTPFVDYWSSNASLYKKKKGVSAADELKNIDKMVEDRLAELKAKGEQFLTEFAIPRLQDIQVLTSDLWKLMVPTFAEMGKRMEKISLEKGGDQPKKLFKQPSQITLDQVDSTKEVVKAKELFIKELRKRIASHNIEIEELLAFYHEARPELAARTEKLNNKEFKKRVKKVESGYYSIRQFYYEQIVSNLFPDSLFCKCVLYCLEPLMQEGEVMEAMTIEKEIKRFIETHSEMLMNRCHLQDSFEEGVQIGRSELAGILGKLFLKEGMRIQGETLALKRQNSLLKSMGVSETESSQKKKSKKKKGNNSTGPMTPSTSVETPSTPTEQAEEEKPAPPPLSRDERLRLVVSGTRLSEQKVKEESNVEKKDSAETKEKTSSNKVEETKPSKVENANVAKKEESKADKKRETTVTKKQEPAPTKKKESKAVKKEEAKPAKVEEPKPVKKEESKSVKKEDPKVIKKEEPKVVKKEEPKIVKKEEPKAVKKEEPKDVKKEEPKPVKKEEPKVVKKEERKHMKKEEPKVVKKEVPKPVKKEEPKVIKKEEPKPVKKEELKAVKKEEPKPVKKEEPKPVKKEEPIVVKKEELKPVKKEEPKPVKKEEPKPVKKEEPKPVKKEEPKVVKKEEPKPMKKEEPKPVKKEEPKPVKKEEPIVVKKEELKPVKKEEPKPVKKEEPKVVRKEEPKPVKKEEPKVVKKEEPKVVKKEEPKLVKKEEPKPVKKEEPKTIEKEKPKAIKEGQDKLQKEAIPQPSAIEQKRTATPEKNSKAANHVAINEEPEVPKVDQENASKIVKNHLEETPRVFENESLKIEWSNQPPAKPKEDAIQDWNEMRKSVTDSKAAGQGSWKSTEKEPESWNDVVKSVIDEPVLSWNALRSEVDGSPVKNSVAQATQETTENAWASPKSINQIDTPVNTTEDGWTTVSKKAVENDLVGQGAFSALNNTAAGAWSNKETKIPETSLNLGGWGSPNLTNGWEKKSTASPPTTWEKKTTASPTTWDKQSNTSISSASAKWGNKSTSDNAGWTNETLPWESDPVDTSAISKDLSPLKSTSNPPGLNMTDKLSGLSQEPSTVSKNASQPPGLPQDPSPLFNNTKQPPGLSQEPSPLFSNSSQSPALSQEPSPSFSSSNQPPGLPKDPFSTLNKPPGLVNSSSTPLEPAGNPINIPAGNAFPTSLNSMNNAMSNPMINPISNPMDGLLNNPMNNTMGYPMNNLMGNQQLYSMSLNQPGISVPPSLNMMGQFSMPFMSMQNMSYQAPLPDKMDEMDSGSLSLLVRNLHQQNSQLIQSVHSMQQEMSMLTTHYTDTVTRTREKESQTRQLFESRKKTEMDEVRRYVEQLESRLQQLEEQSKTGSDHVLGGGFGNQDLFAGYRDEMGTNEHRPYNNNRKKTWSKSALIRCGNCGKTGHQSNECRSLCRYCGSSDHLSDVCPGNN